MDQSLQELASRVEKLEAELAQARKDNREYRDRIAERFDTDQLVAKKVIARKALMLVDKDERVRASVQVDSSGFVSVMLLDGTHETSRVYIAVGPDGDSQIEIDDADGKPAVALSLTNELPNIMLFGPEATCQLHLTFEHDGRPRINMASASGQPVLSIGESRTGIPRILLSMPNNELLAGITPEGLIVEDSKGEIVFSTIKNDKSPNTRIAGSAQADFSGRRPMPPH